VNGPKDHIYEFGDFRIDVGRRLLLRGGGEPVPLTPKVFDTLLYLVEHPGSVLDKDALMAAIWPDTVVEENNLSQNIYTLRRVLGEGRGEHRYVVTVPGRGYRFVADVTTVAREDGREEGEASQPEVGRSEEGGARPTEMKGRRRKGVWPAAALGVIVAGLSFMGLYLWRSQKNPAPGAPIKTLAVLPFKPLVAGDRNEPLELGMADTLIARLSDSEKIVVRPITAVRRYGGLEQDSRAAGRELGVDAVLDGSIQSWGDRIRISARLVGVGDGRQLWAGQFDEKFTDIFSVQDSISERVAMALVPRLGGEERRRLTRHETENIEAYHLYLKGRYHAARLTPPETEKAVSYYRQAIDIDPTYALAYARLANAYRNPTLTSDVPSSEAMPKAKAAALKAVEIDDGLAEGHIALGLIAYWYDWDWEAAERHYNRALELNPNNGDAHSAYAYLFSNTGRHEKAIAESRRGRELEPLALGKNATEAQFLFYAGRGDEAVERIKQTLDLDPNFWLAHLILSKIYIARKMYPEALVAATKARDLSGGLSEATAHIGYILALSGRREEARAVLEELKRRAAERYVPPYNVALVYNGLGERAETLAWLEKGYEQRDVRMTFLKVDPKWDNLRSDARFISLIKRMRLE
jgi:DNA-binding winged helix-turn-helix (wHTH) protein/TolB-like protein/Flp pilus assembly protein TadD